MPEFVRLAQLLRPQCAVAPEPEPQPIAPQTSQPQITPKEQNEALREVRYFRAHLRETLDRALESLLCDIARDVLGRELLLAPAEIASVVHEAIVRYRQCEPLRVRTHENDLVALRECDVPVFADGTLQRGDAVVELRNGSLDLSLKTRLDEILARAMP